MVLTTNKQGNSLVFYIKRKTHDLHFETIVESRVSIDMPLKYAKQILAIYKEVEENDRDEWYYHEYFIIEINLDKEYYIVNSDWAGEPLDKELDLTTGYEREFLPEYEKEYNF